jgi:ATPase family associated with various cellular activities (AAA)
MHKKYMYVWFMVILVSFSVDFFASSGNGKYYGDSQVVNEFYSNKFTDKEREGMIKFLNDNGILSQASMQGTITALEKANLDSFLNNFARIFATQIDNKDFPEQFAKEWVQAVQRGDFPKKIGDEWVKAVQRSDLPQDLGEGLAGGLVKGLSKELKDSKVVDELVGSFNKAFKEAADKASGDVSKSVGKDSKLAKTVEETGSYYTGLGKKFYREVVLENMILTGVVAVGITAALYSVPFAVRTVERKMTRPKLIIESSQLTAMEKLQSLFVIAKKKPMEQMVSSPSLKKYLDDIVKVTTSINTKIKEGKTNVKYRNLLLYGPPGTGKTMFAKELAKQSGLEYSCMSGSSFSKFKDGEGIEALDELFAWAQESDGLIIFIDEADTFLSKRDNMDPQSKAYQLLNNFLNYTGQRSDRFMLVFATNHQHVLDSAMYRRIDDAIEMPLPSKIQRIDALILYKNKILMDLQQNGKFFVDSVEKSLDIKTIDAIAEQTKGLSYGDLEGIINTLKTDSDILQKPAINEDLIKIVVDRFVKKHQNFTDGKYLGLIED